LAEKQTEHRVDGVAILVTLGQWRGRTKVGERSSDPQRALLLYAKDDDEPLPWGRALEELLEDLLAKAEAAEE